MPRHRARRSAAEFDAGTSALHDVSGEYALDPAHTRIGFRARHAMVTTVRGSFTHLRGTAHLDTHRPPASAVEVEIDVASIDTGEDGRDAHLRSADFFDTDAYPTITFVSTAVAQLDADVYRVTGDLSIKDVTRDVYVDFTMTGSAQDPFGNLRVGFEGTLVILRSEWGLVWNAPLETGGVLISDKIQLEFDVSAVSVRVGVPDEDVVDLRSEDGPADGSAQATVAADAVTGTRSERDG